MNERGGASWPVYALAALCAGAIVAAALLVGPAADSQSAVTRTAVAARGVVQATVSGSGNLQAASQVNLGFKTAGVVSEIYVHQGQHVTEGQLLAELDRKSAEVTLEQSRATLQAARATLAQLEENGGEARSSTSTGQREAGASSASAGAASGSRSAIPTRSEPLKSEPTESEATRAANLASARAAVHSDELAVEGNEQALAGTRLYAPKTGTIVSLSGEVGESVSAQGTTKASGTGSSGTGSSGSGSSGTGSSGSGSTGTGAAGTGRGATGASGGSTGSGSGGSTGSGSGGSGGSGSGATFAVLSDLSSMVLVAPLSEAEIGDVRAGQTATVTVEALEGRKLAAHVSEVATLSSSNSGVVSYDVTFTLDQMDSGLKPGMSASAEVLVRQAEGVNVPSSAISAGTVTVLHGQTRERRRVVTGLAGNSTTILLSGLRAGETVLLPSAAGTSAANIFSRLTGRGGGAGGGTRLGGSLGAGGGLGSGPVLFRGAGPGG